REPEQAHCKENLKQAHCKEKLRQRETEADSLWGNLRIFIVIRDWSGLIVERMT
ncbi:16353_t:CDS:2, partial [Dentiscutata heterogama]